MPIVALSQENRKVTEHLRGMLVGAYKTGKSWCMATAPSPNLILDPDQRADSLSGKSGVFTLSFAEPAGLNQQPTVYSDILDIVGKLEESRKLGDIHPKFWEYPEADAQIKTVCLDSIQSTSRAILQHNMYTNPKVLAREIKVKGQNLLFPSGWDTWNSDMECMEQLIARLIAIPEVDFWISFHEDDSKDGSQIKVFPSRHRQITRYFNEVWRVTRPNWIPQAQLAPTFDFTATTTLVGAPPVVENPNITELVRLYGRK